MANSTEATESATHSRNLQVLRWVLLVLVILLIIVLRSPEPILQPSLEAEDGTFVLPYYYAHRNALDLFRFQAGYIPLTLNIFAFLSVRLPTRVIPYGFAWLPLILAVIAYTWLFRSTFREWLGSDAARAFICILFVLAPLSQYHIYANTTYSIWNALFLLLLLLITPRSNVMWRNIVAWAAANILVWSNPLTILVAPIVIVRLVRERGLRVLHVLTLVNLAVYNAIGVEKGGIFTGLSWLESLGKVLSTIGWTFAIVAGTAFRTVFGSPLFGWAAAHSWPLIAVWTVLVVAVSVLAARKSKRLQRVFMLLAYVIFAFTFVSTLSRGPTTVMQLNEAPRYIYLPTLAFLVLLVLLVDHFIVAERPRRRIVAYSTIVVFYVVLNAQLGHYFVGTGSAARPPGKPASPYVQSSTGNGRIVQKFFADLARLEKENSSRDGIHLTADKPGDWPIIVDTRTKQPKR